MRFPIILIAFLLTGFTELFSHNRVDEVNAVNTSVKLGDDIMLGLTDSNKYKTIKFFGIGASCDLAGSLGTVIKITDKGEKGIEISLFLQKSGKMLKVKNLDNAILSKEIITFNLEENYLTGAY